MIARALKHVMLHATASLAYAFMIGCGESAAPSDGASPTFVIEVNTEQFRVRASNAAMQAKLRAHLASGRVGVLFGEVRQGNGGFNAPYRWHLAPETIDTPDVTMELCDGRPSDVEGDLAYWLGTVRSYCPWGAKVVREEP